jgi:hypothetical protein
MKIRNANFDYYDFYDKLKENLNIKFNTYFDE